MTLTLFEASLLLHLAPSTLRRQIAKGRLAATRVGPLWTVTEAEVERYERVSLGRPGGKR